MVDSKEKTGGRPVSVSGGLEGKFSGARVVAVELVMVVGTNKGGEVRGSGKEQAVANKNIRHLNTAEKNTERLAT